MLGLGWFQSGLYDHEWKAFFDCPWLAEVEWWYSRKSLAGGEESKEVSGHWVVGTLSVGSVILSAPFEYLDLMIS